MPVVNLLTLYSSVTLRNNSSLRFTVSPHTRLTTALLFLAGAAITLLLFGEHGFSSRVVAPSVGLAGLLAAVDGKNFVWTNKR